MVVILKKKQIVFETETACNLGVIASDSVVTGCKGGVTRVQYGVKGRKEVVTECYEQVTGCNGDVTGRHWVEHGVTGVLQGVTGCNQGEIGWNVGVTGCDML